MSRAQQSVYDTPFDELPDRKRVWVGKPGSEEEGKGKLSILTPDVVASAASSEIRTGHRVSLAWDLTKLEVAGFNRQPCGHEIVPLLKGFAFDDIYHFNPRAWSNFVSITLIHIVGGLLHGAEKVCVHIHTKVHTARWSNLSSAAALEMLFQT